jgi:chromosome segregation ATPase
MKRIRPKSSFAEWLGFISGLYSNLKLKHILDVDTKIAKTNAEIAKKTNEKNLLLKRNEEIQKIIESNSNSVAFNTSALLKVNKEISDNQKILIDMERQNIEFQKQQKLLAEKMVLINEEQLNIQKLILTEEEIQRKIAEKQENEFEKQKELKSIAFQLKSEIESINKNDSNLTKFVLLSILKKDIEKNNINPNELIEINDKQFALNTFTEFEQLLNEGEENLSDRESVILVFIQNYKNEKESLNKEIDNIDYKVNNFKKEINLCYNNIEKYKIDIANIDKESYFLNNKIDSLDKLSYNKLKIILPFIFIMIGIFIIIFSVPNINDQIKLQDQEIPYWSFLFLLGIVILIVSIITLGVFIYNNPENIKKRIKYKILSNGIKKRNEQIGIDSCNNKIIQNKNSVEKYSGILSNKEQERKELNEQLKQIIENYPNLKFLFASDACINSNNI